jgi:signal transduction histidine kinase
MGIDAADLPHIFTPFFRADRSRTRKTGGVGLGLALVRRIIAAHGGSVHVESQVGQGTQVEVKLPGADGRSLPSPTREQFRTRRTDWVDTGAS